MIDMLLTLAAFLVVYGLLLWASTGHGGFLLTFIGLYIAVAWIYYESTSTTP